MLNVQYDERTDILTVEDIRFAGDFFRELGGALPLGMAFEIAARDDGTIFLRRLESVH